MERENVYDRDCNTWPECKTVTVAPSFIAIKWIWMWFAIKNHLVKRLDECAFIHISDRVTILHPHLQKGNYHNIVSVYALTLDKSDHITVKFYADLSQCLESINAKDGSLLVGTMSCSPWKVRSRQYEQQWSITTQSLCSVRTCDMLQLAAKHKTM